MVLLLRWARTIIGKVLDVSSHSHVHLLNPTCTWHGQKDTWNNTKQTLLHVGALFTFNSTTVVCEYSYFYPNTSADIATFNFNYDGRKPTGLALLFRVTSYERSITLLKKIQTLPLRSPSLLCLTLIKKRSQHKNINSLEMGLSNRITRSSCLLVHRNKQISTVSEMCDLPKLCHSDRCWLNETFSLLNGSTC